MVNLTFSPKIAWISKTKTSQMVLFPTLAVSYKLCVCDQQWGRLQINNVISIQKGNEDVKSDQQVTETGMKLGKFKLHAFEAGGNKVPRSTGE